MYITQPVTLTELYIDNDSSRNKYTGLLNANFQDYMDSLSQSGQLEIRSGKLKQKVAGVVGSLGMALGTLGGPAGIALGFTIGNTLGKYLGNVVADRIYGGAIYDMAEIVHYAKLRYTMLATTIAFNNKMGDAIDTLRQNENKRRKDAIQEMQV